VLKVKDEDEFQENNWILCV